MVIKRMMIMEMMMIRRMMKMMMTMMKMMFQLFRYGRDAANLLGCNDPDQRADCLRSICKCFFLKYTLFSTCQNMFFFFHFVFYSQMKYLYFSLLNDQPPQEQVPFPTAGNRAAHRADVTGADKISQQQKSNWQKTSYKLYIYCSM